MIRLVSSIRKLSSATPVIRIVGAWVTSAPRRRKAASRSSERRSEVTAIRKPSSWSGRKPGMPAPASMVMPGPPCSYDPGESGGLLRPLGGGHHIPDHDDRRGLHLGPGHGFEDPGKGGHCRSA